MIQNERNDNSYTEKKQVEKQSEKKNTPEKWNKLSQVILRSSMTYDMQIELSVLKML